MTIALDIVRIFDAPTERVFACFATAEGWEAWAGPGDIRGEIVSLQAQVGGRFHLLMHKPDGTTLEARGEFTVLEAPCKLAFSWKWGHGEDTTQVTVMLRDLGEGRTEMHFRHEGFRDEADRDAHMRGWTGCVVKLDRHLTTADGLKGAA